MVSGEAYAILTTSEVTLAARDGAAAPIAELATKRKSALAELEASEAATPAPVDSTRLTAALAAKASAEAAVRDKAADKSCGENCRMLLQSAVDARPSAKLSAARAEFDEKTGKDQQNSMIAVQRLELRWLPYPQSVQRRLWLIACESPDGH